jgi:hypothetical protein
MPYFNGHDIVGDCSIMYELLYGMDIKSGTARKELCPTGASALYGYSWRGFLSYKDGKKILRTPHPTKKGQFLSQLRAQQPEMMDFFKEFRDKYFSGFEFDQVMINKNYKVGKHKDSRNVGTSTLISFGDYTNGLTRVWDQKEENYIDYNSCCNPVQFDGSKHLHEVLDYEGDRYALVFFK